eukprot:m51a1_g6173 hypothetical protein (201) ;mRNA; f:10544-11277
MSTRTDRVFAAFQGPVLSVGSAVVHMYREYTLELLLPRHWRTARGLGAPDVVAAINRADARSAVVPSPALQCPLCGGVLSVRGAHRTSDTGLPGGLECYVAKLRSRCTSSRRHLQCERIVVAVVVGGAVACSEPFAVFAREPCRQSRTKRLFVLVDVWKPSGDSEDLEQYTGVLVTGAAEVLRHEVPGFVMQKSTVSHGS